MRRNSVKDKSRSAFAKYLREADIERFIENTYGICVDNVVCMEFYEDKAIAFRFGGVYLHSGVNNIAFVGVFLAKDFSYEIRSSANIFGINHNDKWNKFMNKKFGLRYSKKLKKFEEEKVSK